MSEGEGFADCAGGSPTIAAAASFDESLIVSYIPLVVSRLTVTKPFHNTINSLVFGHTLMTTYETKTHELASAAATSLASDSRSTRPATSLLGAADQGMKLKVSRGQQSRDSENGVADYVSEVIELASRKCLVGSAANCDVRVDDSGIAPIECLILHGAKSNVVRWLTASNEFTGGEVFEDEVLRAGDPLQVGTVELELLLNEIMNNDEAVQDQPDESAETLVVPEPASTTNEDRLEIYLARLERLENQLELLQQASDATASDGEPNEADLRVAESITDLAAQLAVLQSRNATDRNLWTGEKAELESLLQSRLRQLDQLQDEVQRLRDELTTVREEYAEATSAADQTQELEKLSRELAEKTAGFEQEESRWDQQRNDFHLQLQETLDRLGQVETQLADQEERQAEAETARQAAEERAERLQKSVDELSERLAEQQAEFDRVQAEWEADRTALESELADTKEQLEQSATTESIELELREAWDRERKALQSQIDEANTRLEAVQDELEAQQELARSAAEREYEAAKIQPVANATDDEPACAAYGNQTVDLQAYASEALHQDVSPRDSFKADSAQIQNAADNPMDRLLAGDSFANRDVDIDDQPTFGYGADTPTSYEPAPTSYEPTQHSPTEETPDEALYQPTAYSDETTNESTYQPAAIDNDEPEMTAAELAQSRLAAFQTPSNSDEATSDEGPSQDSFADDESPVSRYRPLVAEPASSETDDTTYVSSLFDATQRDPDSSEETEEEVAMTPPSNDPPVSTAEVLARMGQTGVWDEDDEKESDASGSQFGSLGATNTASSALDAFSRLSQPEETPLDEPPRYTPPSPGGTLGSQHNPSDDQTDGDDESIEDYMARLMKRVSASSDEKELAANRAPEPAAERTPITEYTEVETSSAPQVEKSPKPQPFNEGEYKPRSQAPELADKMTAMRSLANDSARSAIASHAKRNWSSVMKMKLGVSVFAFMAVLVSFIFFWGQPVLMGLGTLAGLGVLGYWARTAITYRKLLLDSLMLEPKGGSGDDANL